MCAGLANNMLLRVAGPCVRHSRNNGVLAGVSWGSVAWPGLDPEPHPGVLPRGPKLQAATSSTTVPADTNSTMRVLDGFMADHLLSVVFGGLPLVTKRTLHDTPRPEP